MNCSQGHSCLHKSSTYIERIENLFSETSIEPLVSNEVRKQLEIYINVISIGTSSLFGVVMNIINIIVYWKQGCKDSITLGFFTLSCSDLLVVTMSLLTACCYAAKAFLPDSNIDFTAVHYVSAGTVRNLGYSMSCVLTAVLSMERCCCVLLPFKVKFIFTRSRTAAVIAVILIVHIICTVPFMATQSLRWHPYGSNNGTMTYKLSLHFTQNRPAVEKFNFILLAIITPSLCQVIVTVCVVILIGRLKESSKFRMTVTGGTQNLKDTHVADSRRDDTGHKEDASPEAKLSFRDARLVRTMIFLVVILSMSNIPLLAVLYAQMIIPELNVGRPYQNMHSLCHTIVYVLTSINASANFFVYYSNSTRFRDVCKSALCSKGDAESKR